MILKPRLPWVVVLYTIVGTVFAEHFLVDTAVKDIRKKVGFPSNSKVPFVLMGIGDAAQRHFAESDKLKNRVSPWRAGIILDKLLNVFQNKLDGDKNKGRTKAKGNPSTAPTPDVKKAFMDFIDFVTTHDVSESRQVMEELHAFFLYNSLTMAPVVTKTYILYQFATKWPEKGQPAHLKQRIQDNQMLSKKLGMSAPSFTENVMNTAEVIKEKLGVFASYIPSYSLPSRPSWAKKQTSERQAALKYKGAIFGKLEEKIMVIMQKTKAIPIEIETEFKALIEAIEAVVPTTTETSEPPRDPTGKTYQTILEGIIAMYSVPDPEKRQNAMDTLIEKVGGELLRSDGKSEKEVEELAKQGVDKKLGVNMVMSFVAGIYVMDTAEIFKRSPVRHFTSETQPNLSEALTEDEMIEIAFRVCARFNSTLTVTTKEITEKFNETKKLAKSAEISVRLGIKDSKNILVEVVEEIMRIDKSTLDSSTLEYSPLPLVLSGVWNATLRLFEAPDKPNQEITIKQAESMIEILQQILQNELPPIVTGERQPDVRATRKYFTLLLNFAMTLDITESREIQRELQKAHLFNSLTIAPPCYDAKRNILIEFSKQLTTDGVTALEASILNNPFHCNLLGTPVPPPNDKLMSGKAFFGALPTAGLLSSLRQRASGGVSPTIDQKYNSLQKRVMDTMGINKMPEDLAATFKALLDVIEASTGKGADTEAIAPPSPPLDAKTNPYEIILAAIKSISEKDPSQRQTEILNLSNQQGIDRVLTFVSGIYVMYSTEIFGTVPVPCPDPDFIPKSIGVLSERYMIQITTYLSLKFVVRFEELFQKDRTESMTFILAEVKKLATSKDTALRLAPIDLTKTLLDIAEEKRNHEELPKTSSIPIILTGVWHAALNLFEKQGDPINIITLKYVNKLLEHLEKTLQHELPPAKISGLTTGKNELSTLPSSNSEKKSSAEPSIKNAFRYLVQFANAYDVAETRQIMSDVYATHLFNCLTTVPGDETKMNILAEFAKQLNPNDVTTLKTNITNNPFHCKLLGTTIPNNIQNVVNSLFNNVADAFTWGRGRSGASAGESSNYITERIVEVMGTNKIPVELSSRLKALLDVLQISASVKDQPVFPPLVAIPRDLKKNPYELIFSSIIEICSTPDLEQRKTKMLDLATNNQIDRVLTFVAGIYVMYSADIFATAPVPNPDKKIIVESVDALSELDVMEIAANLSFKFDVQFSTAFNNNDAVLIKLASVKKLAKRVHTALRLGDISDMATLVEVAQKDLRGGEIIPDKSSLGFALTGIWNSTIRLFEANVPPPVQITSECASNMLDLLNTILRNKLPFGQHGLETPLNSKMLETKTVKGSTTRESFTAFIKLAHDFDYIETRQVMEEVYATHVINILTQEIRVDVMLDIVKQFANELSVTGVPTLLKNIGQNSFLCNLLGNSTLSDVFGETDDENTEHKNTEDETTENENTENKNTEDETTENENDANTESADSDGNPEPEIHTLPLPTVSGILEEHIKNALQFNPVAKELPSTLKPLLNALELSARYTKEPSSLEHREWNPKENPYAGILQTILAIANPLNTMEQRQEQIESLIAEKGLYRVMYLVAGIYAMQSSEIFEKIEVPHPKIDIVISSLDSLSERNMLQIASNLTFKFVKQFKKMTCISIPASKLRDTAELARRMEYTIRNGERDPKDTLEAFAENEFGFKADNGTALSVVFRGIWDAADAGMVVHADPQEQMNEFIVKKIEEIFVKFRNFYKPDEKQKEEEMQVPSDAISVIEVDLIEIKEEPSIAEKAQKAGEILKAVLRTAIDTLSHVVRLVTELCRARARQIAAEVYSYVTFKCYDELKEEKAMKVLRHFAAELNPIRAATLLGKMASDPTFILKFGQQQLKGYLHMWKDPMAAVSGGVKKATDAAKNATQGIKQTASVVGKAASGFGKSAGNAFVNLTNTATAACKAPRATTTGAIHATKVAATNAVLATKDAAIYAGKEVVGAAGDAVTSTTELVSKEKSSVVWRLEAKVLAMMKRDSWPRDLDIKPLLNSLEIVARIDPKTEPPPTTEEVAIIKGIDPNLEVIEDPEEARVVPSDKKPAPTSESNPPKKEEKEEVPVQTLLACFISIAKAGLSSEARELEMEESIKKVGWKEMLSFVAEIYVLESIEIFSRGEVPPVSTVISMIQQLTAIQIIKLSLRLVGRLIWDYFFLVPNMIYSLKAAVLDAMAKRTLELGVKAAREKAERQFAGQKGLKPIN